MLPAHESCPPWSDRRGPRCARLGAGRAQLADARSRVRSLHFVLVAQRFQSRRSLQPGPHGPALAENRVLAPFVGAPIGI